MNQTARRMPRWAVYRRPRNRHNGVPRRPASGAATSLRLADLGIEARFNRRQRRRNAPHHFNGPDCMISGSAAALGLMLVAFSTSIVHSSCRAASARYTARQASKVEPLSVAGRGGLRSSFSGRSHAGLQLARLRRMAEGRQGLLDGGIVHPAKSASRRRKERRHGTRHRTPGSLCCMGIHSPRRASQQPGFDIASDDRDNWSAIFRWPGCTPQGPCNAVAGG